MDLPAFHADEFMSQIRSGMCETPNPYNPKQISRISLRPEDVDAIVFWSKNPAPLLPHLAELDERGFRYYFLYTINDYPADLEPGVPLLDERLDTFQRLSDRIGPERAVWRYDPIIISDRLTPAWHEGVFERMSLRLTGSTHTVIISFLDWYARTRRALLEISGHTRERFVDNPLEQPEVHGMIRALAATAAARGMSMRSCAEPEKLFALGVSPGKCVDDELVNKVWNMSVSGLKDTGQRARCRCARSRDIGKNGICPHGCTYCYATRKG